MGAMLNNRPQSEITNTRMEVPAAAYYAADGFASNLPNRPGLNNQGKAINIKVNQYKVLSWPQKDVYQFDVLIGNGAEKRGKNLAVWKSKTVQDKIRSFTEGMPWLWDGNKIAWTSFNVTEQRFMVDLDKDRGRLPQPGREPDVCKIVIRPSTVIRMAVLDAYLSKQMPWDNSILGAINFLDHAMRMWPSDQYTSIKRSFFTRGETRTSLDNLIEAMKGVYTSIRLCNKISSVPGGPVATGLALNVDVANGTFWAPQDVQQAARNLCKERNRNLDYKIFAQLLKPVKMKTAGVGMTMSEDFKTLRKMHKLRFHVKHRGKETDNKEYVIKNFTFNNTIPEGVHAKNHFFKYHDPKTGKDTDKSVYDYFRERYGVNLQYWNFPLIETSRGGVFPMECCQILPNQRYMFKLSPDQTSNMIKFAVTRPKQRVESIERGVALLKWSQDPYLNHFNVKVDTKMTETAARLLAPPEVAYSGSKATPGISGRWDLRGKKFLAGNPDPLKSWGVCIIQGAVTKAELQKFLQVFIQTYQGHGGRVNNKTPAIYEQQRGENEAQAVLATRVAAGNQANAAPQILLYILPGRDSFIYERLKKNNECRFGIVSQMLNCGHVKKAQPQYCSNVCMKLNAKLGGTTCKVADAKPPKPFFPRPTMVIGADVSHATPGSPQASMAAITVSMDAIAARFAAAVQTNGHRIEMITPHNIKGMLIPLVQQWAAKIGRGNLPQHIYYFRDGVSEGQYQHVLDQEVKHMKEALVETFGEGAKSIRWTVTVCTKRHHIRFFPKAGDNAAADKNANPLPGTLVEHDVTHPFEYDFYLCAHTAIQGTARPVHYHVIKDEANVPVNDFQRMVYQMSYQYARSTTPISIFPAIYYAHLAANRARAHENVAASEGARGGQKYEEARQDAGRDGASAPKSQTSSSALGEALPLLPLGNPESNPADLAKIRTSMWYI
ncbi:Piwi domain-containing protein [Calycina marina]|uniref:Piwi domain-containing protein n=1 Tax=Calycina marina TaxID=1763456 RepID=A0A9P7Z2A7_9HELO|nr:Piwi domain-containing protein [Calycina marina]